MSSVLKHWREAASLLLVAKTRQPVVTSLQTTNFELLMLKRSVKSKFLPRVNVFPGGVGNNSDFSPDWMNLFSNCGETVNIHLEHFLERGGNGPPMFSRKRPVEFSKVPSELAFRICAIRETFEESGILLVRDVNRLKNEPMLMDSQPLSGKSSVISDSILGGWRDKVNEDAGQFIKMCQELNVLPDVWSLYEWSNWLTPVMPKNVRGPDGHTKGRRYDVAFFVCVLDYMPNAVHCDKETTELEWASGSTFLLKHVDPEDPLTLAPPQIVELGRILRFTDAEKLKQFAWERSNKRVQFWLPVFCTCDDAALFLYPGDELYPETPDLYGDRPHMSLPGTRMELRENFPVMNRIETILDENEKVSRSYLCNVEMPDGQVPSFSDLDKFVSTGRI